jgi:Zn-dependent peptidase ImmA (M78 family)
MQQARRDQINRLAETIRATCELSTPVDVELAVQRLRGEIEEVDDAEMEAKIEKLGDRFRITVSTDKHENRRRFSVAHELGHLFLHMGYLVDEDRWSRVGTYVDSVYYRYGFKIEEYEANEFAGAFLMPRAEFVQVANRHKSGDTYQVRPIAEHFKVSVDAAKIRGRWLGLFSWD